MENRVAKRLKQEFRGPGFWLAVDIGQVISLAVTSPSYKTKNKIFALPVIQNSRAVENVFDLNRQCLTIAYPDNSLTNL